MTFCLDTTVAIELRDDVDSIIDLVERLAAPVFISVLTRIELENGVVAVRGEDRRVRRVRVDAMLRSLPTLSFDADCVAAYKGIVEAAGFSRRKLVDRMIAAQALVRSATLVTLNGRDFRDVPGLKLLEW